MINLDIKPAMAVPLCGDDRVTNTVCPGSSDPFYIASLLYKMGYYFLDILAKLKNYFKRIKGLQAM